MSGPPLFLASSFGKRSPPRRQLAAEGIDVRCRLQDPSRTFRAGAAEAAPSPRAAEDAHCLLLAPPAVFRLLGAFEGSWCEVRTEHGTAHVARLALAPGPEGLAEDAVLLAPLLWFNLGLAISSAAPDGPGPAPASLRLCPAPSRCSDLLIAPVLAAADPLLAALGGAREPSDAELPAALLRHFERNRVVCEGDVIGVFMDRCGGVLGDKIIDGADRRLFGGCAFFKVLEGRGLASARETTVRCGSPVSCALPLPSLFRAAVHFDAAPGGASAAASAAAAALSRRRLEGALPAAAVPPGVRGALREHLSAPGSAQCALLVLSRSISAARAAVAHGAAAHGMQVHEMRWREAIGAGDGRPAVSEAHALGALRSALSDALRRAPVVLHLTDIRPLAEGSSGGGGGAAAGAEEDADGAAAANALFAAHGEACALGGVTLVGSAQDASLVSAKLRSTFTATAPMDILGERECRAALTHLLGGAHREGAAAAAEALARHRADAATVACAALDALGRMAAAGAEGDAALKFCAESDSDSDSDGDGDGDGGDGGGAYGSGGTEGGEGGGRGSGGRRRRGGREKGGGEGGDSSGGADAKAKRLCEGEGGGGESLPEALEQVLLAQRKGATRLGGGAALSVSPVRWADIGGLSAARLELRDCIERPLRHPQLFRLARRRGVLLYGPPGTGKTLLAKAVATEVGAAFLSVKGPELLDMYVGESERNVRRVFEEARRLAPSVLFFDELDSLAPARGRGADGGGVLDRVVSQLLAELDAAGAAAADADGAAPPPAVVVLAATNRPDLLDPSLLRPGRFDRLVFLGAPEGVAARRQVLEAQLRSLRLEEGVDLGAVAEALPEAALTGADMSAVAAEAQAGCLARKVRELEALAAAASGDIYGGGGGGGRAAREVAARVEAELSEEELAPRIAQEDLLRAARGVVPSVSRKEMLHYEGLRRQFSRGDAGSVQNAEMAAGR